MANSKTEATGLSVKHPSYGKLIPIQFALDTAGDFELKALSAGNQIGVFGYSILNDEAAVRDYVFESDDGTTEYEIWRERAAADTVVKELLKLNPLFVTQPGAGLNISTTGGTPATNGVVYVAVADDAYFRHIGQHGFAA